jgi:predicted transcriptional regulator
MPTDMNTPVDSGMQALLSKVESLEAALSKSKSDYDMIYAALTSRNDEYAMIREMWTKANLKAGDAEIALGRFEKKYNALKQKYEIETGYSYE